MAVARIHGFFFCLAALGCNSIFGVDELVPTTSAATSVASTSGSTAASSADAASSSSSSSGAGGAGGVVVGGSGGAPPPRRVFVTSDTYSVVEIGYTQQANGLCQQIVDNDTNLGGVWRAWISDLNDNAIDNMVSDGPWNTLDGKLVFDSKADIVDAQVDGLYHPIVLDQNLNSRAGEPVWTGTNPQGTVAEVCANGADSWVALTTNSGTYGHAGETNEDWTSAGTTTACSFANARIYCFEQ